MSVRSTLVAVRELLSDPGHWTQGLKARDAGDNECDPNSPFAVKFCLLGALCRIRCTPFATGTPAYYQLTRFTDGEADSVFNDLHSYKDVLNLLDQAIAAAD
jgi:hypothetical protein